MTNFKSLLIILFLIFSNFWIYKIFRNNFLIGLIIVTLSILLVSVKSFKYKRIIILGLFLSSLFFQYQTTKINNFSTLTADQIRIQEVRFKQYPAEILGINFPLGYWFEMKHESYIIPGISKNLYENLDINQYFFGGHPRQRVEVEEFEKFPYSFIPLFILGLLVIFSKKKLALKLLFLSSPLVLIALIGNKNLLGPFSLFPMFIFIIWQGFSVLCNLKKRKWIISLFIILSFLVSVQQFIYGGII